MRRSELSRSPAARTEIAQLVTPCLSLVAPVGMDEDAQTTWFAAAFAALEGYSGREIAHGAKVAMRQADHPSKVVPIIVREIEAMGDYGRDTKERPASIAKPLSLPKHETAAEKMERQAVGAMMRDLVKKLEAGAGA